ncbi:hypothetical protein ASU33_17050 [Solirubrum puertoriconensis]|uniref:Secretion system C-terminal sorting domain-containing protein n=1 Tax=Solirubrum puertoriconensis TaxID=1751427 RepID=A0A9X0HNQ9_SOLP1|nr:hypothetical protein ASU33_17050 [Solirubrum puertoriconensis]
MYRLGSQAAHQPMAPAAESVITSVYPNPAVEQATVELAGTGVYRLEVLDAQGRTLLTQPAVQRVVKLEVSRMPAGTYWVRARDARNGRTATKQFVVQRP